MTFMCMNSNINLTDSKMCVDGSITCRSSQILVLPVRDMLVCAGITVFFGQAKVNDVHQVTLLSKPHEEVVWLHVTMDEILGVDILNATNLGRSNHKTVMLSSKQNNLVY